MDFYKFITMNTESNDRLYYKCDCVLRQFRPKLKTKILTYIIGIQEEQMNFLSSLRLVYALVEDLVEGLSVGPK